MTKALTIIPGFCSRTNLQKLQNSSSDYLAFTPAAMLNLKRVGIHFLTPADIYDSQVFLEDLVSLNSKTETEFKKIDAICETCTSVSHAYTGNILYFLKLFANLLYLEKIAHVIKQQYTDVFLVYPAEPERLKWEESSFAELQSIPMAYGLEKKIQILNFLLEPQLLYDETPPDLQVPDYVKTKALLINTPERIIRALKQKRIRIPCRSNCSNSGKKRLAVIQDGYEVGYLRRYLENDFDFITPTKGIRQTISQMAPVAYDFQKIQSSITDHLMSHFPLLGETVGGLFKAYHSEIVGRLKFFKQRIETTLEGARPAGLLFSVGIRDVVDNIIAQVANRNKIPVFCFQHGGASIFFNNPYQKYLETDEKTEKTLFLNAKTETPYAQHGKSHCIVTGSVSKFKNLKNSEKPGIQRVLYCSAPPSFYTYNVMSANVDDRGWHQNTRDILSVCSQLNIGIDIKLNPLEQNYTYNYFKQLKSEFPNNPVNIVYGIPAESILSKYNLILLDYIATAIFPLIVAMQKPVVVWQKDDTKINPAALHDLRERCHLVRGKDEFRDVIAEFKNGRLATKWQPRFIDRYVYPVARGNPGWNIAAHIKSACDLSPLPSNF